jgi:hypothetical protein
VNIYLFRRKEPLWKIESRDLGTPKSEILFTGGYQVFVAHLPCYKSGVEEVGLINNVMDPLGKSISNLSEGRSHYEKLNHEIVGLKKSNTIYWRLSG